MIRITIKGKQETKKLLERMPQRLGLALVKAMQESAILIQSLAKVNAPVFRGFLRVSIVQKIIEEKGRVVGEVGSSLPYAQVMEFGSNRRWFPPVRDLKDWARRKLGDERLAFVVARKIKERGFQAQPYLNPALEKAQPRIQVIFNARINEAIQAEGGA